MGTPRVSRDRTASQRSWGGWFSVTGRCKLRRCRFLNENTPCPVRLVCVLLGSGCCFHSHPPIVFAEENIDLGRRRDRLFETPGACSISGGERYRLQRSPFRARALVAARRSIRARPTSLVYEPGLWGPLVRYTSFSGFLDDPRSARKTWPDPSGSTWRPPGNARPPLPAMTRRCDEPSRG